MAARSGRGARTRAAPFFTIVGLAAVLAVPLQAQTGTLAGRVRTESGRGLASALVLLRLAPDTAVAAALDTDALGRFRSTGLRPGRYELSVHHIGYGRAELEVRVDAGAETAVEVVLTEHAVELPGVSVEVDRARARFEREAGTTTRELTREELKAIPGVAEADVLRAIEVLPGVVSTSDYASAFNVRGGSADQNLILIDGFPIYNPFHLGGLFSVFNTDMVARAELLAGGFPAEYGGRVSSVLNVESDASGAGTLVDAGVSLLAARVALGAALPDRWAEGIGLGTSRYRVSVRRSYFDQLLRPFFDFPYHLTDVQGFLEGWTAGGSRWTLTAYTGRDVLDLAGADSFPLRVRWTWGNDVVGLRYTAPMGPGRTVEARAGWSRFDTGIRFPDFDDTNFRSRISQWTLRADMESPAGGARLKVGVAADRLSYDNLAQTGGTEFRRGRQDGWLLGAYAQAEWQPGPWLIELGGRLDHWSAGASGVEGSSTVASPRLAVKRFVAGRDVAVKVAAGRYSQFVHSLREEELPLGIDVWVLAGVRAPRTVSDQVQAGVEAFVGDWFVALEAYDRRLDGVATNNFADDPNDPADDLLAGRGRSYGADFYLRRTAGRLRPTIAVSWLRARRRFPDTASGLDPAPELEYAPVFDRRLDVEFTIGTELPGRIDAGLRWNYGSGLPYTRPLAGYRIFRYGVTDGRRAYDDPADSADLAIVLGPRNADRYPAYHRLDVSFRRTYPRGWGRITPYIDILNVYNRRNPLFYFYEFDGSPPRRSGISMFPILPTFGAEVRF